MGGRGRPVIPQQGISYLYLRLFCWLKAPWSRKAAAIASLSKEIMEGAGVDYIAFLRCVRYPASHPHCAPAISSSNDRSLELSRGEASSVGATAGGFWIPPSHSGSDLDSWEYSCLCVAQAVELLLVREAKGWVYLTVNSLIDEFRLYLADWYQKSTVYVKSYARYIKQVRNMVPVETSLEFARSNEHWRPCVPGSEKHYIVEKVLWHSELSSWLGYPHSMLGFWFEFWHLCFWHGFPLMCP